MIIMLSNMFQPARARYGVYDRTAMLFGTICRCADGSVPDHAVAESVSSCAWPCD